jgi:hypothetical protein
MGRRMGVIFRLLWIQTGFFKRLRLLFTLKLICVVYIFAIWWFGERFCVEMTRSPRNLKR